MAPSGRRRRRPTGAPPPLPRHVGTTGKAWLVLLVVLVAWTTLSLQWDAARRLTDQLDTGVLRIIAHLRASWLTPIVEVVNRVGAGWTRTAASLVVVILLLVFRRWRHLFTFLGSLAVLEIVAESLYRAFSRPRPFGITTIGRWAGFTLPSVPVAIFAALLVGVLYTLVVPGRPRMLGKGVVAVALTAFVGARLYLAVDHPLDALLGVALGISIPLSAFRLFTPNTPNPVAYRRGKTAHLDVGGARGEAIRRAIQDQLGLTVIDVGYVGLAGSGGSTPLRIRVAGDPPVELFAKLYAKSHVRSDRWYKLGRTILYGRLEDEAPYKSVRRLVEYEDYALRLLRDVGVRTATPYGIVEITPSSEYLLVTSFFDGAVEVSEAEVGDQIIDEGLIMMRRLWDAGLAHRDIKPANLMVQDGHLALIDPAFAQVRPSPWRQAVDLANMMLVLAVRSDAPRVYEQALRHFTPDEIAEAFAAVRGIASPTQLRTVLKADGRDLVAQFRDLAPPRRRIALQRWGWSRVGLALGVLIAFLFTIAQVTSLLTPAQDLPVPGTPNCGTDNVMVLVAQSVPSATLVPCIASLPGGWHHGGVRVRKGRTTMWLDSDVAGERVVEATLQRPQDCDTTGAFQLPTDEEGTQRFERLDRVENPLAGTRYYLFEGGCVTYRFSLREGTNPGLLSDADQALGFQDRSEIVDEVRSRTGLSLCGAGAPACPGGTGHGTPDPEGDG